MKIGPWEVTKDDVFTFFKKPQVQDAIRLWIAGPSGWFAVHIGKWFGLNTDELGMIATWAIYLAPFAIVSAWSLAQKTHQAIIDQAAKILAENKSGTIVVNPATATPKLVEAAKAENKPNVVMAGTDDAHKVAATGTPS